MSYRDTIPQLDEMIEQKFISVKPHPAAPLLIYNYTPKAQFGRMWNEATRQCRGLILDTSGEIVSRPFRKFFNLGEEESLPEGKCHVWEKYDGSLGVMYFVDGRPAIASRGSFTSDQALKATGILEDKYGHTISRLDPSKTYLFEIIYPDNRIVVDYGDREDLILLATVDTATGTEYLPDDSLGFPVAQMHDEGELDPFEWMMMERDNAEGFVMHWPDHNFRIKIKHDEYVRLHRIVTGFSLKALWQTLKENGMPAVNALCESGTPTFAAWASENAYDMQDRWQAICREVYEHAEFYRDAVSRPIAAEIIKKLPNPHLHFALLDGKSWPQMAWDLVKPTRAFETHRRDGE